MKLVKFKEFLNYPIGTVYLPVDTNYPLEMNAPLCVKIGTVGNDFCYHEILCVDYFDKEENHVYCELLNQVEDDMNKKQVTRDFPLDRDSYKRDGSFDENSWYMVFDKQEINHLIKTLQEAIILSPH